MTARVTVLGGGFAGLAAVNELVRRRRRGADIAVTLVDRRPWSVFAPMLPDLISGRVAPSHVRYPLEPQCRRLGVRFLCEEVRGLEPDRPAVATAGGEVESDYVLLALGCETNYYGRDEMARRVPGLKSPAEALTLRDSVLRALRPGALRCGSFLVVGGGYTGFEIASHVAYLLRRRAGVSYRRLAHFCRILILEVAPEPLRNCSPSVRRWAQKLIGRYGVELRTETSLDELTAEGVARLSDGSVLRDCVAAWAAGVTPGAAVVGLPGPRVRGGRLAVDRHLRLPGAERVFAAGDVAGAVPPGGAEPLRMGVQFSLVAGRCAAGNIVRSIEARSLVEFDPLDPGYVIPLAPGQAAGRVLGCRLRGWPPYALHYMLCVLRSWGMANRWNVFADLWRMERQNG
jgi:NADH dehydrogenase